MTSDSKTLEHRMQETGDITSTRTGCRKTLRVVWLVRYHPRPAEDPWIVDGLRPWG